MNNELKNSQIKELLDFLEENKSEESKLMEECITDSVEEIKSYDGIGENTEDNQFPFNVINKEISESNKLVSVDPITGKEELYINNEQEQEHTPISEVDFDENSVELQEKHKDTLKDFGISETDAAKLFEIINRMRSGEKFNIYHELPNSIRVMVKQLNGPNHATLNSTTKDVLNHFIREMYIDQEFVDLQESIKKELELVDISEMYSDQLKNNMEVTLLETAAKLESEGQADKAEMLRKISAAFIDSYTFKTINDNLRNNEIIRKKIKKDLSRFKRFTNDFNFKYNNSKFKINDIRLLNKVLPNVLESEGISGDDIKKFIIIICKVTKDMQPNNPEHHTFMYYTISNLISLQYLKVDKSEFGKEIFNNVVNSIKLMKEVE